jgi:hypothetical protein
MESTDKTDDIAARFCTRRREAPVPTSLKVHAKRRVVIIMKRTARPREGIALLVQGAQMIAVDLGQIPFAT